MVIEDPTIPCICCHTTLWKYLEEIAMFTKWVKQSGMKDSNCHVIFNNSKIVVEKVLSADVEHYLINWQNYSHSVHTAQPTEWSLICVCVISITRNCFWSWLSTCNPPSCLQVCQTFTCLKSFSTGGLGNRPKFVKMWLLKILPHFTCAATLPCVLSLIMTLV